MLVKPIGSYREQDHGDITDASLKDAIRSEPQKHEKSIIDYLKNGTIYAMAPCIVTDVLDTSNESIIGELYTQTDGTWIWPSDLAYYVERYHVELPTEFVEYMRENDWHPPHITEDVLQNLYPTD